MPNYRRAFIPGGCWFFTVNLLDRRETLLVDEIDLLRDAVIATRRNHAFAIDAFVVLPDHLHAVLSLPDGDPDFSTRWRLIKNRFARALPKHEPLNAVRRNRNERGMSNIAISIRSSTVWSRACEIGRTPPFTETYALESFRSIGQAMQNAAVISASDNDPGAGRSGGLRFANPPYNLFAPGHLRRLQ
jgi:REP element-mobilizing transposase RayT